MEPRIQRISRIRRGKQQGLCAAEFRKLEETKTKRRDWDTDDTDDTDEESYSFLNLPCPPGIPCPIHFLKSSLCLSV
jgi:hypothetical protein